VNNFVTLSYLIMKEPPGFQANTQMRRPTSSGKFQFY